ncbi:hypothetical protein E2C01_016973 [Portunus trituberculatus]|uniref:Uncharacterized protein n=1 Tax=Portunus trituberculatus TaxID=210409 RepID=A0A5B7DSK0_PORTR|nr:hypothetical protein [Portunus trituberculatus]
MSTDIGIRDRRSGVSRITVFALGEYVSAVQKHTSSRNTLLGNLIDMTFYLPTNNTGTTTTITTITTTTTTPAVEGRCATPSLPSLFPLPPLPAATTTLPVPRLAPLSEAGSYKV